MRNYSTVLLLCFRKGLVKGQTLYDKVEIMQW